MTCDGLNFGTYLKVILERPVSSWFTLCMMGTFVISATFSCFFLDMAGIVNDVAIPSAS